MILIRHYFKYNTHIFVYLYLFIYLYIHCRSLVISVWNLDFVEVGNALQDVMQCIETPSIYY